MTDQYITTLTHGAASCKIHSYGATVLSFISDNQREHLFVSRDALLDGSKPIRGGIPIVFPIFGPPGEHDGSMPQHGFARCNFWKLETVVNEDVATIAVFSLALADAAKGRGENNAWSAAQAALDGTDCKLEYQVRLENKQLTTTLIIKNTGTDAFNWNCLLHTYFAVDNKAALDGAKTHVDGLGGYAITDKITGERDQRVQSYDEPVFVDSVVGEIDAVFEHPEAHPLVHAKIAAGTTTANLRLEAAGQVNDEVTSVSCVVWNPGKAKAEAMADFGSDQYPDMLCVEPGLLGHQPLLNPGQEARLTQSIIVL
jgi:glucose-6-phosphate 1-epimerase